MHCRGLCRNVVLAAALLVPAIPSSKAAQPYTPPPDGWSASIIGHEASPAKIVAVAKKDQTLFLFERHSPLRLAAQYPCTTGQNEGDKLVEGDMKTPEGVYFVGRRIGSGLPYEKYGYEAYTLNYPNPVDRLRKKTGSGIWIHGRGVPITPYLTEGCISLNNTDIGILGTNLKPGTPVTLAAKVAFKQSGSSEEQSVIDDLHRKTFAWAKAWSDRSKTLFDYYDPAAYAAAQGQSFATFRQQKERVFKKVSFIDIKLRNVQSLQGPGYWVTWFQQEYRASNLTSRGVRRLYWQRDAKGEFRIVGMEWAPNLSGTLTAGINNAPIASAVAAKATAAEGPDQPPAASVEPVAVLAAAPPADKTPDREAVTKATPTTAVPPNSAPVQTPPQTVAVAEAAPQNPQAAKPKAPDVSDFIEQWRSAWERGDVKAYMACYADNALQGNRKGAPAILAHKRRLWKRSAPKQVRLTNIRITTKQGTIAADMQQSYLDSNSFADMGIKTLHLQLVNNSWRIIREDWSPVTQ